MDTTAMPKSPHQPEVEWTDQTRAEFRRKRRGKNLALMAVLLAFVVLVYIVAVIRMGSG
jgi:hypothetical protein